MSPRSPLLAALAVALVAAGSVLAAGGLDRSFGDDGRVVTEIDGRGGEALAVTADAQGRIVAAGYAPAPGSIETIGAIARYKPGGALDPSFGGDGTVTFGDDRETVVNDVEIDRDGRIVTAGYEGWFAGDQDTYVNMAVRRFLPDGTPDASFGEDGAILTGPQAVSVARGLEIDTRGRILIAGYTSPVAGESDLIVTRLEEDGKLDRGFGKRGSRILDFAPKGENSDEAANDLAIDRKGGILLAGYTNRHKDQYENVGARFTVFRLDASGKLDRDFGRGGKRALFDRGESEAESIVVDDRGIAVAGTRDLGEHEPRSDFAIARLTAEGRPERRFGERGMRVADFGGVAETAKAIVSSAGARLTIAGSTGAGHGESDWVVLALTRDGRRDHSFSGDGERTLGFGDGRYGAKGLARVPSRRVVAAGDAEPPSGRDSAFGLARFNR